MDSIDGRGDLIWKKREIVLIFAVTLFIMHPVHATPLSSNDYISLIRDIRELYTISTVFFSRSRDDYTDLQLWSRIQRWTRVFSSSRISTCTVSLSNLHKLQVYYNKISRPLFVVFLSEHGVKEFANATQNFKMAFPLWLVIFLQTPENTKRCHQQRDNLFNVAFNTEMFVMCGDDNVLREWYSIEGDKMEVSRFATWSPEQGFNLLASRSMYLRRNNLKGLAIRTVEVVLSARPIGLMELFTNIMDEMMKVINFTVKEVNKVDDYGRYNAVDGNWTGAIGEIYSGHADIGFGDYSMIPSRLQAVDYLLPLMNSRNCLFIKESASFGIQWFAYFRVLNFKIWIAIFLLIIVVSVILVAMTTSRKSIRTWLYLLFEETVRIWGIFCQQGPWECPKVSSLKLVYLSISLASLVTYAAYSAALISFLTISKPAIPFSSLEGFVEDGSYKLIVIRNTAEHEFFENSKHPLIKRMASLMLNEKDLPRNLQEAYKQVCEQKVAFYSSDERKKNAESIIPCKITEINIGQLSSIAMVISKQNPFSELINYYLKRLIDIGVLHRLKMKFARKQNIRLHSYTPVSIESIAPILIILAAGIILSVILLIIERYYSRRYETKITGETKNVKTSESNN